MIHFPEQAMKNHVLPLTALAAALLAAGCATTTRTETRSTSAPSQPAPVTRTAAVEGDVPLVGPPGAEPGQCYARIFNPARYETQPEQVLKTAASERIDVIPAKFEEVDEQVLVKPATTRLEVIPAQYETVEEQVLVEPARKVVEQVPAQFETVSERVMVKPAVWAWKKASEGAVGNVRKVDPSTGEVLCLVETPAQYETVSKQVVKTPATTREREIPAAYKTVQKQVMKTPASTREVQVPAEYTTMKVRKMVAPASEQRIAIPAQYDTVQRTVLAEAAREEWRQVLCDVNATPDQIRAMQDRLRTAGYDPGPSTGEINEQTRAALRSYQQANNLPVDRGAYVNMATAETLGVAPQGTSARAGNTPVTAATGGSAMSQTTAAAETRPDNASGAPPNGASGASSNGAAGAPSNGADVTTPTEENSTTGSSAGGEQAR
jgi:peptidoglycan hydrolase-like protein with peptidoglycan-binding domain